MGMPDQNQTEAERMRRGKAYLRAYARLIEAAEQRQPMTYGQIADIMGLPPQGSHTGRMLGVMLWIITERERECGRPMLSAAAVSSTNQMPGRGFYALAEQYGLLAPDASTEEKRAFWRAELDRLYAEWQQ
jgi:hypothetical protein